MVGGLEGKRYVVTGGTGALGRAVVGALLEGGAEVILPILGDKIPEDLPELEAESLRVIRGIDLMKEEAVVAFFEQVPRPLYGSIHLAGGAGRGAFEETSAADFERMWRLNALTAFLTTREALSRMGETGRILNVAARPPLEPRQGAGRVAYTAAKAALAAMTQALAEELCQSGRDILINAIAPSSLDTSANRRALPDADPSRWPKVEQVAATITFLASPHNRATRGGSVPVYGRS